MDEGIEMSKESVRGKYKLSPREYECLTLWACGYTIKAIGIELEISARTAETHINRVKGKMKLRYKNEILNVYHEHRG